MLELLKLENCMDKEIGVDTSGGDRLANYFLNLHGGRLLIAALAAVIFSLLPVLVSIFEGNFINPQLNMDSFHDLGYYMQLTLGLPTAILIAGPYFSAFPKTLQKLVYSSTIEADSQLYSDFIKEANRFYSQKVVKFGPYLIGLIVALAGVASYVLNDMNTWNSNFENPYGTVAGWCIPFVVYVFYYLLAVILTRIITSYFVLKRFFYVFRLKAQPFHPDGCGGLSSLGQLAVRLNVGTFLFGIIVSVGVAASIRVAGLVWYHPVHWAIIIAYFAAAVVLFFLPLAPAHKSMRAAKTAMLTEIYEEFSRVNTEVLNKLTSKQPLSGEDFQMIQGLNSVAEIAESMPVYPFDITTMRRFLSSIIAPVLLVLMEVFLGAFV